MVFCSFWGFFIYIYIYFDKYFRTIFIKLIPCYELSIAICSPYGRKTAHDIVSLCFAHKNSWIKTIKQKGPSRVRVLQDRYAKQNDKLSDNPNLLYLQKYK